MLGGFNDILSILWKGFCSILDTFWKEQLPVGLSTAIFAMVMRNYYNRPNSGELLKILFMVQCESNLETIRE